MPLLLQPFFFISTKIVISLTRGFQVKGMENLSEMRSNAIFAANHTTELDPILIRAALPIFSRFSPFYFVALPKKNYQSSERFGIRSYFYGGKFFEVVGGYATHPGKKDYKWSLQDHIQILKLGYNLCIFPEGKFNKPEAERATIVHGGVAFLATYTKTPVIPVHIHHTREKNSGKKKTIVSFGKKMEFTEDSNQSVEALHKIAEKIMNAVYSLKETKSV